MDKTEKLVVVEMDDIFIETEKGESVCEIPADGARWNSQVANAAEIVKRWNSHDELLDALESVLLGFTIHLGKSHRQAGRTMAESTELVKSNEVVMQARKAINNAKS